MAEKEFDQDTLERLKKFLKDFDAKCGKDIVRMRKDREFACGDQWNEYVSTENGRPEAVFNIIDNFANAILNPFLSKPFDITYTKVDETSTPVDKINLWVKELQNEWQTKNAVETGLDAAIKCGRGFFYATNTEEKKAAIFAVDDPTMVMFDPNSTEINGSDAEQVAVVEYISKNKAKSKYSEYYDEEARGNISPYLGDNYRPQEDSSIIIHYYEMQWGKIVEVDENGKKVEKEYKYILYTRFLDGVIISQQQLPLKHIPVVPICGSRTWLDKHRTFVGITHKLKYPQMVINYAVRQLMERLARTPKSQIIIGKTALQGNEKYYENADKNLSPLLPFNDFTSNGAKIDPPVRFDNSVQCDDIIQIVSGQIDLMSSIVGMPSTGIANSLGAEETAESILLRTKSTESNVSHYIEHAKQSMKQLGEILLEFYAMYSDEPIVGVRPVIGSGPETITSKMEARRQLLALSQLYPENMKPVIAYGITKTLDNIEISSISNMLAKLLPPEVLSDEIPQVAQLQQQMQQVIAFDKQQMAQKDETIKSLQNQILQLQLKTQSDYEIAAMNNASKEKIAAMQLMGKQQEVEQKGALDAQKMYMDADLQQQKAQAEIETKQKIASIDLMKKLGELDIQKQKNELEIEKQSRQILTQSQKTPE